ncbi:Hypothetical protein NTJ_08338 [Nesidiocoris tenuis]|uniref:C2H2-type domain-containing protein n=1 Tax=Nesidiocoris tenuis TaxID=355587 RepID=A0ABN7AYE0_9HEMI|nr:Hypothetical protein NTJ_08338 [Nesidiocoris tenuis]
MQNNHYPNRGTLPSERGDEKTPAPGRSRERHMTDAVHPFFVGYKHQFNDAETSTSDDLRYFCKECSVYIPLSSGAVVDHFEKRTHLPVDSCVYCGGPVCEYFYNKTRNIYHNCCEIRRGEVTSASETFLSTVLSKWSTCDIS